MLSDTIDPNYKIPPEDWLALTHHAARWVWVGDGVLATLYVDRRNADEYMVRHYNCSLEFEMLDTKLYYENKNLAEDLRKGDANGWNSTADYEAGKIRRAQLNERLIRNAIARGDAVFEQP